MSNQKPAILLYDGKCGICREWVDYWRQLTRERVVYRAYQDAAGDFTAIPVEDLQAAIHLIEPDGTVSSGANATFGLYQGIHPQSLLLFLHRYLPGFGYASELTYRFFSRHRSLLAFITHLFWGRRFEPTHYQITSWLFLRSLGCIYLAAFLSFSVQANALIGADGVMPLPSYLNLVKDYFGQNAYLEVPTLFWFLQTDGFIRSVCLTGVILSLCLTAGLLVRTSLVLLYVLYLSLVQGGQIFMTFQWDLLLLECGFLAMFLPWGSTIIILLYRWLLFRFIFLSGVVKIISGDITWDSLTALNYHFETQPLPTPFAWYAHHFPETVLKAATGVTLIVELIIPFLIFTPRRFRHIAAWCFLALQTAILLTGNYNFFNLLAIAICLFLFDDAAIKGVTPSRILTLISTVRLPAPGKIASGCALFMAVISVYVGGTQIDRILTGDRTMQPPAVEHFLSPFGIINSYGPFAAMTTVRNEIVIEGSADNQTWQEYQFKYKPGNPEHCPVWVAPHQPRIDWQMWFAALSPPQRQPWFRNLLLRMLQNSEPVTAIFSDNPFPDMPPISIRARYYQYTFTSVEEHRKTGRCWNRRLIGEYYPVIRLKY